MRVRFSPQAPQKIILLNLKSNIKGFTSIGFGIIFILSLPFISTFFVKTKTSNLIYKDINSIPKKEIALVLGAAAYPSRLSDILQDRVDTSIELYKNNKVEKIIMSGSESETNAMKNYAIKEEIPEKDIIEDINGLNTIASIQYISKLNKSVIIVTQKFHLPRALFLAKHYKLNAIGIICDKQEYLMMDHYKKREILATSKAILDVSINLLSSL